MWASVVHIIAGLWLIFSAGVFHLAGPAANNNHIAGPLVITFAVISLWDINRHALKVNAVIGAWLLLALFLLPYNGASLVSNAIAALIVLVLSLVKRKTSRRFGGGWRSLFQKAPLHLREAQEDDHP